VGIKIVSIPGLQYYGGRGGNIGITQWRLVAYSVATARG
jgi:hypothetical protein